MALNKDKLKSSIVTLLTEMFTRQEDSMEEFADRLASGIDTYVKDAEIIYTGGLTAPNGPVAGTFKGTLK